MLKINLQSFGDIITNSSSEIYCIFDNYGIGRLKEAVSSIIKAFGIEGNVDDYVEIELEPLTDNYCAYDNEEDRDLSTREVFEREFGAFSKNLSNEEVLKRFPEFYENFCKEYCQDDNGRPNFDLKIVGKNAIGKAIENALYTILNAFEHIEVYDV